MSIQVIGSVFRGRGQDGDFAWMIEQPEYADALFIFNDNEEQFTAFVHNHMGGSGCAKGGGNAVIRPYQCTAPRRACGIPTGRRYSTGGYWELDNYVRSVIDKAINIIRDTLAEQPRFKRVIYSAASESGELGTGIFNVCDDVKRYIVEQLKTLAN